MNSKLFFVAFIGLSLIIAGCVGENEEPTPTPTINATATPTLEPTANASTPTPVIEVTVTPNATLAPPSELACGTTAEGSCVAGTPPLQCMNGLEVENCGVCGCPTGQVCGRISDFSTFKCWDQEFIEKNNGTIFKVVSPTPSPNASASVSITPTPTLNPTIAPLPSPYPDLNLMKTQLQLSINESMGRNLYFQGTGAHDTYQILDSAGSYINFYLYDGVYAGWTAYEVERLTQLNTTLRKNYVMILNDTDSIPPNEFKFKMECYNWKYSVEVLVRENPNAHNKQGFDLAKAVSSYCR